MRLLFPMDAQNYDPAWRVFSAIPRGPFFFAAEGPP